MSEERTEQGDRLFAEVRALPAMPPSAALSAHVLALAHAALETRQRPAAAWAVASAVVAAIAVYLTWAVEFLARLAST
jgi:hypothetical protein